MRGVRLVWSDSLRSLKRSLDEPYRVGGAGWTVRVWTPVGQQTSFHILPDWSWSPPDILYVYQGSFPWIQQPGRGVDHPPYLQSRLRMSRALPLLPLLLYDITERPLPLSLLLYPIWRCTSQDAKTAEHKTDPSPHSNYDLNIPLTRMSTVPALLDVMVHTHEQNFCTVFLWVGSEVMSLFIKHFASKPFCFWERGGGWGNWPILET
jgi:hypothetical protein